MKCGNCGNDLGMEARFCGRCGTRLSPSAPAAIGKGSNDEPGAAQLPPPTSLEPQRGEDSDPAISGLLTSLRQLLLELSHTGLDRILLDALSVLALGPSTGQGTVVIVGEKSRGKTTVVNRLLGVDALPVGAAGLPKPVLVRPGDSWKALAGVESRIVAAGLPLQFGDASGVTTVEGPSPILRQVNILDTPGLNDSDEDFDQIVVRAALQADAVVVVLATHQLLSETERRLIRQRLLPIAGTEMALAVSFLDRVESEDDLLELQRRVSRFMEKCRSPSLRAFFIPPSTGTGSSALDLETQLLEIAGRARARRTQIWKSRVARILEAIDTSVENVPQEGPDATATTQDTVGKLLKLVASEHDLALMEATALLRSRFAALRLSTPDRLSRLSPETIQHEAIAEFLGGVQAISKEVALSYLETIERQLGAGGTGTVQAAAKGLKEHAGTQLASTMVPSPAEASMPPRRAPDKGVALISAAGAVAVLLSGGAALPLIGGALSLVAASRLRASRNEEFERQLRGDASVVVGKWLGTVEEELVGQLKASTATLHEALRERISATSISPVPISPAAKVDTAALRMRLKECLTACADGNPN